MAAFGRKTKGDGYYQHDDRISGNYSGRHVSFKSGSGAKNRVSRQRGWDNKIRKFMEDDVDMMSVKTKKNSNVRFYQFRGRGAKGGMNKFMDRRSLSESSSSWYKITLCHGKKYNRQEIMKALQAFIQPIPFLPVAVKMEEDDMTFFVDNYKTAQCLYTANLKIQMRDGWKIQIKVTPHMPFVELNEPLKEKIKQVMSSKYDTLTRSLDLSRFHSNEEFLNNDLFVPLNRQNMLLAVFQIIAESVPNLYFLNLSDNKIFTTEHFSVLKRHAAELKSLDLSKNKIKDLCVLNCLQGLKLESLVLDDNPLCDKFQDQTTYVREVRKIFTTLLRLDGVQLPPPVNFDIDENLNKLPQSHRKFLCNESEGGHFTLQFLKQYFFMYDNQHSRDMVAEAYAETAQFSMTAYSPVSGVNLNKYISESRNLKKVSKFERRSKLLHVGKMEIVRFLNTLPKTQHDLSSFNVDLTVFTPNLISLCICGVFRETDVAQEVKSSCIKAFSRTFVLIPIANGGFNIVNDMLTITNATDQQLEMAFQPQPSTSVQVNSPNSVNFTQTPPIANVAPMNPQEAELNRKREMVTALAMQTGMNLMWAEKCLVETNWDINNAMYAFTEFNKLGKIPMEAFNK
ncbi:hypothetical protein PGB90_005017 [Kerria lacca]